MSRKVLKKQETERSVYDAALDRIRLLYDRFDSVHVSFSGGKDSTAAMQLALTVAHERGRLPLDVFYWDEEAVHPTTIEYVERVRQRDDVRMKWVCLPCEHRNACSRKEPYWYPWDPDKRDLWVREPPPNAVMSVPGFKKGMSMPESMHLMYGPEHGSVASIRGIRADESMRRYQAVAAKTVDNWIAGPQGKLKHFWPTSPIYDWTTIDVWTAPAVYGWDYNRTYDLYMAAGIAPSVQRVCPPFGEEPLRGLWLWAVCFPEIWHKMIGRVHGAATAARYAKTELYGYGKMESPPPGVTWREWTFAQLELYPPHWRKVISANIASLMRSHKAKTNSPIPEVEADIASGLSWKFLAMIVNRGDLKGRRAQNLTAKANQQVAKLGLTLEDALALREDLGTRY